MIDSLVNSFKIMIKKPIVLIVAIVAVLIQSLFLFFAFGPIIEMLIDVMFLNFVPDQGLASPVQFVAMHPIGTLAVFGMLAITAIISTMAMFIYSRYVKDTAEGSGSGGRAVKYSFSNLGKIIGLMFFFCILFLGLGIVMWVLMLLALGPYLIVPIILFLLMLFAFYLAIKLAFAIPIMAMDELPIREALKKSWEFSAKNLWGIIALFVAIGIILMLINGIGANIIEGFFVSDIVAFIIFVIFSAITFAYSHVALPLYYLKKEYNKAP